MLARLLILGGSAFQVPAILHARRLGYSVFTCDYLPGNPGHQHAEKSFNVSTTDIDAVLALARRLRIDGILAFASDPAAYTAAVVASALNLPGCEPQAVRVLSDKALFREYLHRHGFEAPKFVTTDDLDAARELLRAFELPVMVKPTDSSGSKGVTCLHDYNGLAVAFAEAKRYSRCGSIVMEEWIGRDGWQIAGDGIVVDGKLAFDCFGDEHFDEHCSPYAPTGESFPGHINDKRLEELRTEVQRLMSLLGIRDLVFNLDAMFDRDGEPILIEIGPRAGGNCLPQLIKHHTGVDEIDIAIRQVLGISVASPMLASKASGFHASWMIHSRVDGRLSGYRVADEIAPYLLEVEFITKPGNVVQRFASSEDTLGYGLFSFPDAAEMGRMMSAMPMLLAPTLDVI